MYLKMNIMSEELMSLFLSNTHSEGDYHDDMVYLPIECLWFNLIGHVLNVHITFSLKTRWTFYKMRESLDKTIL